MNFAGGVLAWGFLIPLLDLFHGAATADVLARRIHGRIPGSDLINAVWRYIVRPIAVGGMMTGAAYTLFRMRKGLFDGLKRAVSDLRATAQAGRNHPHRAVHEFEDRVLLSSRVMFACMIALYIYLSHQVVGGVVAAIVMLMIAFFFATVSGYLVGIIGSTNNPISGLTLTTLIIAALLMVSLGVSGPGGVAVVLGVAAVGCVSSAVAGELLQDFKVGYILGGTPRRIQMVGTDRGGGGQRRDVLAAVYSASREHQGRRHRIWRSETFGAAGRIDGHSGAGHRGRRHAVAAGGGGRDVRRRDDHGTSEEPHAGGGGNVSSD